LSGLNVIPSKFFCADGSNFPASLNIKILNLKYKNVKFKKEIKEREREREKQMKMKLTDHG